MKRGGGEMCFPVLCTRAGGSAADVATAAAQHDTCTCIRVRRRQLASKSDDTQRPRPLHAALKHELARRADCVLRLTWYQEWRSKQNNCVIHTRRHNHLRHRLFAFQQAHSHMIIE